jgi:hypothetical protein
MATDFAKGRTHDFKLFKDLRVHFKIDTEAKTNNSYQGITDLHHRQHHTYQKTPQEKNISNGYRALKHRETTTANSPVSEYSTSTS